MFAIDESHAAASYWISSRNTLLAAVFGLVALLAHLRWRESKSGAWPWALLASAALVASLLSAEAGLCSVGYLLGWSLCCEPGRLRERLAPLIPSPALTFTTLSLPITDLILARPWTSVLLALGCVMLLWALAPVLRSDARARAWLVGMMLAAVPLAMTWPTTRLLPVLSIGAAPLVGLVYQGWRSGELRTRAGRAAAGLVLICNLILAPLAFVFAGLSTRLLEAPTACSRPSCPRPAPA